MDIKVGFTTPVANLDLAVQYSDYLFLTAKMLEFDSTITFLHEMDENVSVYLDNGAYELGESVSVNDYITLAETFQPDVIIVPDRIKSMKRTIELAKAFFEEIPQSWLRERQIMIVPQGRDLNEWRHCFLVMFRLFQGQFHLVGVPKYLYPSRLSAIRFVWSKCRKPCHLLGCQDPSELGQLVTSNAPVLSVDTTWPARYALGKLDQPLTFDEEGLTRQSFEEAIRVFYEKAGIGGLA